MTVQPKNTLGNKLNILLEDEESSEESEKFNIEDSQNTETLAKKNLQNIESKKGYVKTPHRNSRIKKKPRHLEEDYAVIALQAETYVEDLPDSLEEIVSRDEKQE